MSLHPELDKYAAEIAAKDGYTTPSFCGKGAFKETYCVFDGTGRQVALKLIDTNKCHALRVEREINAIQRCNSDRIGKLLESAPFKSADGRQFVVVIEEFFGGGSLEDRLKQNIPEDKKVRIAHGLAQAVKDLHPLRLVHRDIKPANVMFRTISDWEPVLVDFGLVRDLSQTSATATWMMHGPGTPLFASPEQLNNDKVLIDWRSDQFAVGVVTCWMILGRHPYQEDGMNPAEAVAAVASRRGPAKALNEQLKAYGLQGISRAVSAWPVARFPRPDDFLRAFNI